MNLLLFGLTTLPLCMCQFYEHKESSVISPSWIWGQRLSSVNKISGQPDFRERKDGTTNFRTTADTLPILTQGLDDRFTTLDEYLKEGRSHPTFVVPSEAALGGLRRDEVYYADNDIIIIKGGGFKRVGHFPSHDNHNHDYIDRQLQIPSLGEQYNGNIAAVVSHPFFGNSEKRRTPDASQFYPFSLFLPASVFDSKNSQQFPANPSQAMVLASSQKRSNFRIPSKVNNPYRVYSTNQNRPHVNSVQEPSYPSRSIRTRPIPPLYSHKEKETVTPWRRRVQQRLPIPNPSTWHSLKDDCYPSTWHSLKGDTAVNFIEPIPNVEQDAELLPSFYKTKNNLPPNNLKRKKEPVFKFHPIGVSIQRVENPRL